MTKKTEVEVVPLSDEALKKLGISDGTLRKRVASGEISLAEVITTITPAKPSHPIKRISLPANITDEQKAALKKLAKVYGQVVPTERRELTDEELIQILDERETIDVLIKFLKERKEDQIRTTVLNHMDVEQEGAITGKANFPWTETDKDGHYLIPSQVLVPGTDQVFSWEVSGGDAELSEDLLEQLDAEGKIDHELYLAVTEPVRRLNQQKFLEQFALDPEGVTQVIAQATVPGKKKGSLYVRKAPTPQ